MKNISAIGFDLFNTLITAEPNIHDKAMDRLIHRLKQHGFIIEDVFFRQAYQRAALNFLEQTRHDGRESHNRFWISAALKSLGFDIPTDDPRIAAGVAAYFSAFFGHCHPIPGT